MNISEVLFYIFGFLFLVKIGINLFYAIMIVLPKNKSKQLLLLIYPEFLFLFVTSFLHMMLPIENKIITKNSMLFLILGVTVIIITYVPIYFIGKRNRK